MKALIKLPVIVAVLVLTSTLTDGQTFNVLHNFTGGWDGGGPRAGLTLADGQLFGTTVYGTTNDCGTVFAMNTNGSGFRNLHVFGFDQSLFLTTNSDGEESWASMLFADGVLYGTTYSGGTNGTGTAFAVSTDGSFFTNLYIFGSGNDGTSPAAGLVLIGNVLYGTTSLGGTNSNGTLFKIDTNGTGYVNMYDFTVFPPPHQILSNTDGAYPDAGLVLVGTNLYGITSSGGLNEWGTVFSIHQDGTGFMVLHEFSDDEGGTPLGGLLLHGNKLYGTKESGGLNFDGSVFAINADGSGFTNLYSFTGGNDGAHPWCPLAILGYTLYGTTDDGGANSNGTVFAINIDGTGFTNLHSFTAPSPPYYGVGTNSDGANPYGGLVICGNTLYGTAKHGGSGAGGTVFSITLPLPALNITLSGTNVVLTWPTNGISYTLQSANNLVPPVTWSAVLPLPAVVDGQNTVTNPVAATQQFYRLSQ
jgi:uncharacterized repeat protein (TIGR03803 family)